MILKKMLVLVMMDTTPTLGTIYPQTTELYLIKDAQNVIHSVKHVLDQQMINVSVVILIKMNLLLIKE